MEPSATRKEIARFFFAMYAHRRYNLAHYGNGIYFTCIPWKSANFYLEFIERTREIRCSISMLAQNIHSDPDFYTIP